MGIGAGEWVRETSGDSVDRLREFADMDRLERTTGVKYDRAESPDEVDVRELSSGRKNTGVGAS